ncbi:MAG TPA: ester cyclase [Chthoniobacterales bacterium]|nr:ester cyclase [Chthoniobacterales bacterium]
MNALEVTQRQVDAWNGHDADVLFAVYAEGASYHSPRFDHPLTGKALADFLKSVLTAFPDLRLEVISSGDTGGGLVASQWVIHGTHTGPFMDGTSPTGRTVVYAGASFVQVQGDKIQSEHVYLDRQTVAEQLGLKAK